MRWRLIVILAVVLLALLGAAGHFLLGWWQPPRPVVQQANSGFDTQCQPATLPEVLDLAHDALHELEENVHDYSAVILKEERFGNAIVSKWMFMKFRSRPFSVYLYFLDASDADVKGREVIYVEGRNDNKLLVHTPGLLGNMVPPLAPNGFLAMRDERYPITEIGLANLCRQLIKRGEGAGDPSRVQVKRYTHARINKRPCTMLEVIYPVDEKENWGYLARIFVDDQYHFPTRVEVHELPRDRKQKPRLVEQYTYIDLKLNNGYTDADFDPKNRQYKFP